MGMSMNEIIILGLLYAGTGFFGWFSVWIIRKLQKENRIRMADMPDED